MQVLVQPQYFDVTHTLEVILPQVQTPCNIANDVNEPLPFTPIRVYSEDSINVIVGTLGEVLRVIDGEIHYPIVRPFPTSITSGVIINGHWIATWVDHELQIAKMASLCLTDEWNDGPKRSILRKESQYSNSVEPTNCKWSQTLNSEPMALSRSENDFLFGILGRGIYKMNSESEEIWRIPIPNKPGYNSTKGPEKIISIFENNNEIHIFFENNWIAVVKAEDGSLIRSLKLNLSEKIQAVFEENNEYFISLKTGNIAILENIYSEPQHYSTPGPVLAAKRDDKSWIWTGWRHDGKLANNIVKCANRTDIGVAFIGDRVLSNDGQISKYQIS